MTVFRRTAVIAYTLSLIGIGSALAAGSGNKTPMKCVPLSKVTDAIKNHPGFSNFRPVSQDRLKDAVELFNALPPETNTKWDAVYLIDGPSNNGVMVVGLKGKACEAIFVDDPYWRAVLRTIDPPST